MARRVFKSDLSVKGIDNLIKQLNDYKQELLNKCELFVRRLAEYGIETAKANLSQGYGQYIAFTVETNPEETGCTALMVATQTGVIRAEWQVKGGEVRTADVSPLLMSEFGSGQYAIEGHRGTFPGQTHAFENSWSWMDLQGEWHTSSGVHPTQPMAKASNEMIGRIREVAQEVFGQ